MPVSRWQGRARVHGGGGHHHAQPLRAQLSCPAHPTGIHSYSSVNVHQHQLVKRQRGTYGHSELKKKHRCLKNTCKYVKLIFCMPYFQIHFLNCIYITRMPIAICIYPLNSNLHHGQVNNIVKTLQIKNIINFVYIPLPFLYYLKL